MACDAYLSVLQMHASSFETGRWAEMMCREASHRLVGHDVTEFNSDSCSAKGLFFPVWKSQQISCS
jgi:hypothetical protein